MDCSTELELVFVHIHKTNPTLSSKVVFQLSSCNLCCVKTCPALALLCPVVKSELAATPPLTHGLVKS